MSILYLGWTVHVQCVVIEQKRNIASFFQPSHATEQWTDLTVIP